MMNDILLSLSPLGIVLATLFSFAFGMLWYGPLFGKTWMKLAKVTKPEMKHPVKTMSLALITTLMVAVGLNLILVLGEVSSIKMAITLGLLITITLMFPPMFDPVLWKGESQNLVSFNTLNKMIDNAAMMVIITLL